MIFTGFYEHLIDTKNRLAIPSKIRGRLNPERDGEGFAVVPGRPSTSLWLYTVRYFEELAGKAEAALIPDEDQLKFDQIFFPLADMSELDSQGRILLPERMIARAGLAREVIICGVRDHLEIHPREAFEKHVDASWEQYREYQYKARAAYREMRRQTGPEAGST